VIANTMPPTKDRRRCYDRLVDLSYKKGRRVNHGNNEFALGPNHINGIESFWSYAKCRLAKLHGVRKETFPLHLKETKFRFNLSAKDLYKVLLSLFRKELL
jgi:transposase